MLICSVCRSQNMDSAKFCGNCGSPFSQPSSASPSVSSYAPTPSTPSSNAAPSSLINCPQGHIYSSVYQDCPYCPQYETSNASEYETRIEEGPIQLGPLEKPQNDFSTRTGADTLFEPLDSNPPKQPLQETATEVISAINLNDPSVEKASISSDLRRSKPDVGKTPLPSVQPPPPEPPRPEAPKVDSSWNAPSRSETPSWEPRAASPVISSVKSPSKVDPQEQERRTVFVADPSQPIRTSKGRIVGWLISYSHNPDGDDFRVYAGYNRIGANPVCDIVIEDDTVSGSHAIIVYRDGRCLIKDDLSRNGTFVNGREIGEAYPLQSYDQVRIGNTYLTFISAQRIA